MPHLLVFAALTVLGFINFPEDAVASAGDARQQGARTFVVAASDNFPPVNMLDKDGNLSGFGRDLSTAVIKAIGGQTRYVHAPVWSEVLGFLSSGQADFIHDTAYAKDRDVFLDFSEPILEMKEVIIVRSAQYNINSIESMKGKTVACVNKHITHLYLMQFPEIKCQVVKTPAEGLYSLVAGDVEAFVYPEQIVTFLSQELRLGGKIKVAGEPLRTLKWSMVVKEGDKELLGLLNKGLHKVRLSGEYDRIYAKWFGKTIFSGYTPKEIRFFGLFAVLLSVALGISTGLLISNTRLRSSRNTLASTIAERKKAEEAARQSHERLRRFVDANIVGIVIASPSGDVIEANDYYLRMIGYSREEFEKGLVDWRALTPPEWLPADDRAIAELRARGTCTPYEKEYVRRDGTRVSVYLSDAMLPGPEEHIAAFVLDITERKEAEERVRISGRNLAEAERIGNTGSWTYEVATDTASWSANMFRIFDVDTAMPRELVFKHFVDKLVHPEDRAHILAVFQDALIGKRPYDLEYRIIKRDGSVRLIHALAETLRDGQGKAVRMIGKVEDVTERKKSEEQLKRSETLLQETQRLSKIGGWEYDVEQRRISWTEEVYRIYGVSPEEHDPNEITADVAYYVGEDRRTIEEAFRRAVAEGEPYDLELRFRNARGEDLWVRTIGRAVRENGRTTRVSGNIMDITERKQVEMILRREEEKFRNLFNNAEVGMFRTRIDGSEILEANEKFLEIFGRTREEVIGRPSVIHWADPREREEMVRRLKADQRVAAFECRMLDKKGEVKHCLTSLVLYPEQGILEGSIIDITERKRTEEELRKLTVELERRVLERTFDLEQRSAELDESRRALINLVEDLNLKTEEVGQANARLLELDRLKSMFIASMSHELRTPLNSIIGFTGIILQGLTGEISAEQRKQLGMVQGSARHLLALINDIIDISKIEAGKVELLIREFDMAATVREVIRSLETTAAGKGLKLTGAGPERLPVTSDERRVKQVALNLVGNAVKFTDQGEIAIRLAVTDGRATIAVRDSGPGIREEELELLFKAFSRLPTGDRTIKEGTGLGLYLSKRIADLLGGEITCASEYGKGSTFTFSLPQRPLTPALSPSGGEGNPRIRSRSPAS